MWSLKMKSNVSSANQWRNDSHPFFPVNLKELREATAPNLLRATEVCVPSIGQTPKTVDLPLPTMQPCPSPLQLLCQTWQNATQATINLNCFYRLSPPPHDLLIQFYVSYHSSSHNHQLICVCVCVHVCACSNLQAWVEFVTSNFKQCWLALV